MGWVVRTIAIPGGRDLVLAYLLLDLNGTLTDHGRMIEGVAERLRRLAQDLELHLVTADTLGTAEGIGAELGVSVTRTGDGEEKATLVRRLGAARTVAVGNGRNDEAMLRVARLGVAVIGPEGAASTTVAAADVICRSIFEALDLLLDDRLLAATLRP